MDTTKFSPFIRKILAHRRKSRIDFMLSKVNTKKSMKIIDIGCGIDGRSFDEYIPADWNITGIDLAPPDKVFHNHPNFTYLQQDAQDLSRFKDGEFDLAVSVGMMEHITDEQVFNKIVSEIQRVAKQYIVVVPYKYCWIEVHYGVPFFPLLPYSVKQTVVKTFNLCKHREILKKDPEYINKNYKWRSNSEYLKVFPGSKIFLLPTLEMIAIIKNCQL